MVGKGYTFSIYFKIITIKQSIDRLFVFERTVKPIFCVFYLRFPFLINQTIFCQSFWRQCFFPDPSKNWRHTFDSAPLFRFYFCFIVYFMLFVWLNYALSRPPLCPRIAQKTIYALYEVDVIKFTSNIILGRFFYTTFYPYIYRCHKNRDPLCFASFLALLQLVKVCVDSMHGKCLLQGLVWLSTIHMRELWSNNILIEFLR